MAELVDFTDDDSAAMDLDSEILHARESLQTGPQDVQDQVAHLNILANLLEQKYEWTREPPILEELVSISRKIVELTATSTPNEVRAAAFGKLGSRLGQRFSRLGQLSDLEEAVDFSRKATKHSSGTRRSPWLNNLSNRLAMRFHRIGAFEDLQEAVATSLQAIESTPADDPDMANWQGNYASHLSVRHSFTGNMDDLNESLRLGLEAIKGSQDSPDQPKWLHNHGQNLGKKYLATGTISDLDDAVSFARQAVEATPETSPERTEWANSLSLQLKKRYLHIGAMADITEAITVLEEAIEGTPADDPYRVILLHSLANCLGHKHVRSGAKNDLQNAISIARQAKRALPKEHRDRPVILNTLSSLLSVRYCRRGGLRTIEDATNAALEAVEWTEEGHPDRARWLCTYGRQLAHKSKQYFQLVGEMPVLPGSFTEIGKKAAARMNKIAHDCIDKAVDVTRQAIDSLPPGHSDIPILKADLGNRLNERSVLTGTSNDIQEACECFRFALYSPRSSVRIRLSAGKDLLSIALKVYEAKTVFEIAQYVVDLIPLLVPNSLRSGDKHYLLVDIEGIASLAAAVALNAGQKPLVAISLLEAGRAVLESSLRDLRTDLAVLEKKHPQLAHDFVHLRETLDSAARMDDHDATTNGSHISDERMDQRCVAEQKMSDLVREIRKQTGFENFLLPASESQLLLAASNGPVVMVNVSPLRCDALIILKDGFQHIELPKLHLTDIIGHKHQRDSISTLEWLWDNLVEQVLDELGYTEPPSADKPCAWPCIWWIPTGQLVSFPIHAAGYHTEISGFQSAIDRVISSYSSSVKSLIHVQSYQLPVPEITTGPISPRKIVLVSMEDTPGDLRDLQYAAQEVLMVDKICRSSSMNLTTIWPDPHRQSVLSALTDCFIFHFAGHGYAKKSNPLDSLILLEDWITNPLTVETLIDTNLVSTPPFLAYLSACGTGQVRQEESLDEGMHLSGAFQLAGFRHVIGTLWEVNDRLCVDVASKIYEHLRNHGINDESVRAALHHTVRQLRYDWIQGEGDTTRDARFGDPPLAESDDEWKGYNSEDSTSSSSTSMSDDSEESEYDSEDYRAEEILMSMFNRKPARSLEDEEGSDEESDGSWESESGESSVDDSGGIAVQATIDVDPDGGQSGTEQDGMAAVKRDIGAEGPPGDRRNPLQWIQYVHYGA
ncbi:uncharacterized protein FMAN_02229 [Fusarium mangiferae]|uniref:FHA domain-containing protein n=1 Tax=Fusarium mangiferae TaxID=192010 RepID=A0A1L7TVJ4_FUSMA|nr:uncharacterized protein FMAN_02229 [Fusarium mangiferae]CVK99387.1 uncharacterized protein FMAN_02229 [Fusarium mangiferae]